MKHSNVTVSIITHTALEQCKRTLEAILPTLEGAKLILTSNGNPEAAEYFENIAMRSDGVEVIVNTQNLGFIEPSNLAFEKCETEYFVLLNDDAIPPTDWLDKMKACFDHERVAIAGPGDRWLDDNFVGHRWRAGDSIIPDYIEGSCMMVKVAALRDNNEPLFWPELQIAYCDDAELCLRMRARGYLISVSDFTIFHKAGTTSRTVPGLHEAMRHNFALCREKWSHYLKTRKFS